MIHLPLRLSKSHALSLSLFKSLLFIMVWFVFAVHLFRELGVRPALAQSLRFAGRVPVAGVSRSLCALLPADSNLVLEVRSDSGLMFDL